VSLLKNVQTSQEQPRVIVQECFALHTRRAVCKPTRL
jgi:hypothetical protein